MNRILHGTSSFYFRYSATSYNITVNEAISALGSCRLLELGDARHRLHDALLSRIIRVIGVRILMRRKILPVTDCLITQMLAVGGVVKTYLITESFSEINLLSCAYSPPMLV